MLRESGNLRFPIWWLGDSNPVQWQDSLTAPFDPRHPIRHNIWSSILDVIQDNVFRQNRCRVDSSMVYIRNAVDDPAKKPRQSSIIWMSMPDVHLMKRLKDDMAIGGPRIWEKNFGKELANLTRTQQTACPYSIAALQVENLSRVMITSVVRRAKITFQLFPRSERRLLRKPRAGASRHRAEHSRLDEGPIANDSF